MSPCEAALAEIRSTSCNNVKKMLWLEAKGAVRRLGEIPQLEIFPSLNNDNNDSSIYRVAFSATKVLLLISAL